MAKQKVLHRSPIGIAEYAFVNRPQTQFNPEGVYKTNLIVDPNEDDVKEMLTAIKAASSGQVPYSKREEDGMYVVKFSSKYQPKVALANGSYLDPDDIPMIGNGSKVRVAYTMQPWDFGGKQGVKLYLQGLQILDLVPYEGEMFDDESDGEEDYQAAAAAPDGDDDMPF